MDSVICIVCLPGVLFAGSLFDQLYLFQADPSFTSSGHPNSDRDQSLRPAVPQRLPPERS